MKAFTMVARHGVSKDMISGFTLITPDYQTALVTSEELKRGVASGNVAVSNLAPDGKGGWKSTNGSIENYTMINSNTNMVEGVARAVILDRVEKNNKLIGYTVFTQQGTIVEMSVKDAVALTNNKMISNGKIRHTESGDIVSAIGGNYPLRVLVGGLESAPKGETSVELMFFGETLMKDGKTNKYYGAIISCTSATEMTKIIDKLSKSNAAVIAKAVEIGGQKVRKELAIKRMGANSLYGVFELSTLKDFVNAKAKVQNSVGKILISTIKYAADGSGDAEYESVVTLDKSWGIIGTQPADEEVVDKAAKQYASKLIEAFGTIKM